MARLDKTVGVGAYDDIFSGAIPASHIATISLKEGNGVLERGTIVSGAAGEGMEPVSSALEGTVTDGSKVSKPSVYILAEAVDTGDSGESTIEAFAYKTGCFARQRLSAKSGYEMTASDWDYLRGEGLITEDIKEAM